MKKKEMKPVDVKKMIKLEMDRKLAKINKIIEKLQEKVIKKRKKKAS